MLNAMLSTMAVFLGMLACGEIGRRVGVRHRARDPEKKLAEGAGAAEAAVFALLGLLIAFTFSGAASRFEDRRHLVTDEANAIGTAYLRVDLLPADAQPDLRRLFRRYTDVRASTYQHDQSVFARFLAGENQGPVAARLAQAAALQQDIWNRAISALRRPDASPQATVVVVAALNDMIDITTTRVMATRNHPPLIVFLLLVSLGLVGAVLVGYSTSINAQRDWFHSVLYAAILSLTMYVIVDLEYPRLGLIQVNSDQVLVELAQTMR